MNWIANHPFWIGILTGLIGIALRYLGCYLFYPTALDRRVAELEKRLGGSSLHR